MTNWFKRSVIRQADRSDYMLILCSKKNNITYACELEKDEFVDMITESENTERIILQNKINIE